MTVDSPDRDDLTWYVHWRVDGASVWGPDEVSGDTDPGTAVSLQTGYVAADSLIEIEVAYLTGDGRFSDWSPAETVSTSTASLAPDLVTALGATGAAGSATITWRNSTTSNFAFVRLYRGTTTSFGAATQIGGDRVGGLGEVMSVTDTVAAGTYRYWVRPYSTAGVAASPTGPETATVT